MPVTAVLTPSAVAAADYPIAQSPRLGAEKRAYLTTKPSRLLGVALATADGVLSYRYVNTPTSGPGPGPIVVVVLNQFLATVSPTIVFGGLTGVLAPAGWAANTTFNFPVGRAVELTGTYSAPTSTGVPVCNQALQGSKFALVELPVLGDYIEVGCTRDDRIKLPTRTTKNIACGLETAEWTKPGKTEVGELEITGLNFGADDGLYRFGGMKTQAMVVTIQEDRVITQRDFFLDYVPALEKTDPADDAESTIQARGMYNKVITLVAP